MKVTIKELTKKFGDFTAVDHVSAEFDDGKLIALLGPSGCGKTTMLNMLSGILPSTEGKIFFDDEDVTDLSADKRGVGLVFQNYALYPHMTVLENVCFPLRIRGVPKKERIEKAMKFINLVHIEDYLDRKPAELSGGQQQRVAITRALIKKPKLLLLDEPLSNLDAKLRVEMREEIRRIQKESGVTTIFVTHDQEEASSISDSIMLLKRGVQQQFGTVDDLCDNPVNLFTADFLGTPTINQVHGTWSEKGFVADGQTEIISFNVNIPTGTRLIYASRAEALKLNQDKQFEAEILEKYKVGKDTLVRLKYGNGSLRAYTEDKTIQIGDIVGVGMKDFGVFLFEAESGKRLL
ncbi:MAG: ABC transporter ATP-binding protein [Erysipelotrichaceae bacterium]|nr:ABC transporter ATP-binding protein [Erysipelotrichaceae bacterium]